VILVELRKLIRRPRTWLTIGLLTALPTIVAIFLATTKVAPRPGEGPAFLSAVLANGALYPAAALGIVLPIFLPVAVAVIAGDSVAGEASAGTLRYLVCRPVGRTRLLVAKLVSVIVFVLLAVVVVAGVGYLVGTQLFGSGPLSSTSGTSLSTTQATLRTILAVGYVGFSMLGVAAVAMFLSTVTDSALGAALGALALLVTSQVLVLLDAAASVRPYLPTRYWLAFVDLFRDPVLWRDVGRGFALQAVYVAVFLAAAWANFATKDVAS
jgi:ABC-2 type transport system permease protein